MNLSSADILAGPDSALRRATVAAMGRATMRFSAKPIEKRLDGYRSKLEAEYAHHLDLGVRAGTVRTWAYEPIRLRIGNGAFYTPDFVVQFTGKMPLRIVEVKGPYRREAAMVRLKSAAKQYGQWWKFEMIEKKGGTFVMTEVS